MKGFPLIYSGQEAGLNKALSFFEKDTINWTNLSIESHYKLLTKIKKENIALWNGQYGGEMVKIENSLPEKVFSFYRAKLNNTVILVANLNNEAAEINLSTQNLTGEYTNANSNEKVEIGENTNLKLAPWQVYIFTKH
jgi:hypothetical protein